MGSPSSGLAISLRSGSTDVDDHATTPARRVALHPRPWKFGGFEHLNHGHQDATQSLAANKILGILRQTSPQPGCFQKFSTRARARPLLTHRPVCHLTELQNSAVVRHVDLSVQLHDGEANRGSNRLIADAFLRSAGAGRCPWLRSDSPGLAVALDAGVEPSFRWLFASNVSSNTAVSKSVAENSAVSSRQLAWGHREGPPSRQTTSRGITLSRWARQLTLRCLAAGRTSLNCHGMISMVNVLGWQRPHTNLQHPQNIYVHDKTRRCKQLQMEQEKPKTRKGHTKRDVRSRLGPKVSRK